MTARVSVVIPCLNEARRLPGVLDALATQTLPPGEIIVVDGGSTDGTPDVARSWAAAHPGIPLRILSNPHRHIPHALNLGLAAARGEIIARLDGHAQPAPDYLERCLSALAATGADVVGGAWEVCPGGPGVVAEAIALAVSSPLGAGDARYRLAGAPAGEVDTVPFGCFRRALWQRQGGYNEALLTNEDYEFNARVRRAGGRVWFEPGIRCRYFARATLGALVRQYARYGWWKAQMLKRYPGSLRLRQALPLAWTWVGALTVLGVVAWPALAALWLSPWVIYGLVLGASAARLAGLRRWKLWAALLAAYAVIHFAWGGGAWAGLVLGSRPPG